jgi:hypothetical protein
MNDPVGAAIGSTRKSAGDNGWREAFAKLDALLAA